MHYLLKVLFCRDVEKGIKSSVFAPEIVRQMHSLIEEFNLKTPSSRPGSDY